MTNISLLDMGRIKKRSVREAIISILSREFPLSIKKVYNKVKKEYHLDVTYQAVFNIIKDMTDDQVIEKLDREYKLNMNWIKQLEDELKIIQYNYLGDSYISTDSYQEVINSFISGIGPKIKDYIGKDEACLVAVSGGGKLFGMALWKYLLKEGIKLNFVEFNAIEEAAKPRISLKKEDVNGKKVMIIDSAIHSGKTYELVMKKINQIKNKFKIKDVKFITYRDMMGLADFKWISFQEKRK
jgi:hypoxanthine phosphoribosyltransferase